MSPRVSAVWLLALLLAAGAPSRTQEPVPQLLLGLQRALWREDRAQLWMLCAGSEGARVRVFDPWLREQDAQEAQQMPAGGTRAAEDGSCALRLWASRELRVHADGRMEILPLWWESAPRVQWGAGWASVQLRNAQPLSGMLWRRAGDAELHVAPFVSDRFDGALQRAQLHGIVAGERLEFALPDRQPHFPPQREPSWHAFTVPAVAPDGARATSEWPAE